MTERKFTEEVEDKEVIKALECCCVSAEGNCRECPLINDYSPCSVTLTTNALDLINRQKVEIERLKEEVELLHSDYTYKFVKAKAKTEAIKEFAERLRDRRRLEEISRGCLIPVVTFRDIEKVEKEMTEDKQ